jgi:hypothetical protein
MTGTLTRWRLLRGHGGAQRANGTKICRNKVSTGCRGGKPSSAARCTSDDRFCQPVRLTTSWQLPEPSSSSQPMRKRQTYGTLCWLWKRCEGYRGHDTGVGTRPTVTQCSRGPHILRTTTHCTALCVRQGPADCMTVVAWEPPGLRVVSVRGLVSFSPLVHTLVTRAAPSLTRVPHASVASAVRLLWFCTGCCTA